MSTDAGTYRAVKTNSSITIKIKDFPGIKPTQPEAQVAILWLDDNGFVRDCNMTAIKLLGCHPADKTLRHISTFLPQLRNMELLQDSHLNPYLRYVAHVGHQFEVLTASGARLCGELFFSEVERPAPHALRLIISLLDQNPAAG
ncbi:hypothetical protein MTYP_00781 [Methylophilaceae bacterium]|nr:hypothetical protein MTYP_00781 [Methylophilaceae bacterium]